jgi:ATP-dependent Clp protease protease subunit
MEAQYWIPTVQQGGQFLDVYSSMLTDGIIFINAPIDQRIAGLVTSCLLHISSNTGVVQHPKIYLNSKHGDIISSMSIVDIIEYYKKKDTRIQTMGFGEIGVAAGLILAAGTLGFRKVAAHSRLSLRLGIDNLEFGGIQSEQAKAREEGKMRQISLELFAKYSGQTIEVLRIYANKEGYLDATEAKDLKLVDEII